MAYSLVKFDKKIKINFLKVVFETPKKNYFQKQKG